MATVAPTTTGMSTGFPRTSCTERTTSPVTDAAAGLSSHIAVTLVGAAQKNSQHGSAVSWVERAAGSFKVHLTEPGDSDIPFTYTVVNP